MQYQHILFGCLLCTSFIFGFSAFSNQLRIESYRENQITELKKEPYLLQISKVQTFLGGSYDGLEPLSFLEQHGNFGLGTFDGVDGELVLLDGTFFQVLGDGTVKYPDKGLKTPFAAVAQFVPIQNTVLDRPANFNQLKEYLLSLIADPTIPHAFRISGHFKHIKLRSIHRQVKPFLNFSEVIKKQTEFFFEDLGGTLVCFWFPNQPTGYQPTGFHMHLISSDFSTGGHVLETETQSVEVKVQPLSLLIVKE